MYTASSRLTTSDRPQRLRPATLSIIITSGSLIFPTWSPVSNIGAGQLKQSALCIAIYTKSNVLVNMTQEKDWSWRKCPMKRKLLLCKSTSRQSLELLQIFQRLCWRNFSWAIFWSPFDSSNFSNLFAKKSRLQQLYHQSVSFMRSQKMSLRVLWENQKRLRRKGACHSPDDFCPHFCAYPCLPALTRAHSRSLTFTRTHSHYHSLALALTRTHSHLHPLALTRAHSRSLPHVLMHEYLQENEKSRRKYSLNLIQRFYSVRSTNLFLR